MNEENLFLGKIKAICEAKAREEKDLALASFLTVTKALFTNYPVQTFDELCAARDGLLEGGTLSETERKDLKSWLDPLILHYATHKGMASQRGKLLGRAKKILEQSERNTDLESIAMQKIIYLTEKIKPDSSVKELALEALDLVIRRTPSSPRLNRKSLDKKRTKHVPTSPYGPKAQKIQDDLTRWDRSSARPENRGPSQVPTLKVGS